MCLEDEQNHSQQQEGLKLHMLVKKLENQFLSPLIEACRLGKKHLQYAVQIRRVVFFMDEG